MDDPRHRETQINGLLESGIARDRKHALEILVAAEARQASADLFLLYAHPSPVREAFGDAIIHEDVYNHTNILVGKIRSGSLGPVAQAQCKKRTLVLAALKELVPRRDSLDITDGSEVKLVAFARDLPFRDRDGILLSPFRGEEVRARGSQTIDERNNLFRIEFEPIAGDYVLGMFDAWRRQPESDSMALVLYIAKKHTFTFS